MEDGIASEDIVDYLQRVAAKETPGVESLEGGETSAIIFHSKQILEETLADGIHKKRTTQADVEEFMRTNRTAIRMCDKVGSKIMFHFHELKKEI